MSEEEYEQSKQNHNQPLVDEKAASPDELRARLVEHLRNTGSLTNEAVVTALTTVPRHLFLPAVPVSKAYADEAIPTHWQDGVAVSSASQPIIVAIMLQQLQLAPGMRVLEIGAGTGYNAALLAELVGPTGSVTTLDIEPEIVAEAQEHLANAGYTQVRVVATDGANGWPAGAPYDRIILTVGASDIAPAWFKQLREDGLLVLPLWLSGVELSIAFRKRAGMLISESQTLCGFMRLRGQEAGAEQWVALPKGRKLFTEHAAALAAPVTHLLGTRPHIHLWTHLKPPAFFQHLSLRGYHLVAIYNDRKPQKPGRHAAGRWGIYVNEHEAGGGASLAIFASSAFLLFTFGSDAAEHILEEEFARWQKLSMLPIEQWHITAHPRTETQTAAATPYAPTLEQVEVIANQKATAPTNQANLASQISIEPGTLAVARRHFVFTIATAKTMGVLNGLPASGAELSPEP